MTERTKDEQITDLMKATDRLMETVCGLCKLTDRLLEKIEKQDEQINSLYQGNMQLRAAYHQWSEDDLKKFKEESPNAVPLEINRIAKGSTHQ